MTSLLGDCSVLEVTKGYTAYAGKLLSDAGADVTRVVSPGVTSDFNQPSSPEDEDARIEDLSALSVYLNTGKQIERLDPQEPDARTTLLELASDVDILLEDHLPNYGLTPSEPRDEYPGLIVVSVTGFGRTGTRSHYASTPLIEAAMGGLTYQSGYPDTPPTTPGYSVASYVGNVYGAIGALLALRARSRVGGQHVDVSRQDAVAAHLENVNFDYELNDRIPKRGGNIHPLGHPVGMIYSTEDGEVCVCPLGEEMENPLGGSASAMWLSFCRMLNREDLLKDERFNALPEDELPGATKRRNHHEALDSILEEELSSWTKEDFYHTSQDHGVTNTMVSTPGDLLNSEQLSARDFYWHHDLPGGATARMPGVPYLVSGDRPGTIPPHKTEGQGNSVDSDEPTGERIDPTAESSRDRCDTSEALSEVRVLDFTTTWAGPMCTQILADMGADVIKVESETFRDMARGASPLHENQRGDPLHGEDRSAYFQNLNRNKRSLTVDLKKPEGKKVIKRLIKEGDIDVVVENFSGGTMDDLGLDYDVMNSWDDELIMVSLSGYGQTGPHREYRVYGPNAEAQAGLTYLNGFPDRKPVRLGVAFLDPALAVHGTFAMLGALRRRRRTGEGSYLDISQMEVGASIVPQPLISYSLREEVLGRRGNRDELDRYVQGIYRCSNEGLPEGHEGWIAITLRDEEDWKAFQDCLDHPNWTKKPKFTTQPRRLEHHDELDDRIEEWTSGKERYRVMETLQDHDIPAGVVQTCQDLYDRDDHLRERRFWRPMEHPTIGELLYPSPVPRMDKTPGGIRHYAPMLGQHTREVLYELTSINGERVGELEEKGVI